MQERNFAHPEVSKIGELKSRRPTRTDSVGEQPPSGLSLFPFNLDIACKQCHQG